MKISVIVFRRFGSGNGEVSNASLSSSGGGAVGSNVGAVNGKGRPGGKKTCLMAADPASLVSSGSEGSDPTTNTNQVQTHTFYHRNGLGDREKP